MNTTANLLLSIAFPKANNKKTLNKNYIVLDNDTINYKLKDSNEWVNLLYEDLLYPSKLRHFLQYFGIDVKEDRSAMIPLIELYIL